MRAKPCPSRHSREGGTPVRRSIWISAFAGMTLAGLAVPAIISAPLSAQTPAANIASPVAPIDPDRLEAARELIDVIMPPDRREAMVLAMSDAMLENIFQGILNSPEYRANFENSPEAQARFVEFLELQRNRSRDQIGEYLPVTLEAMARSYARQLTVRQLVEVREFYQTDAGEAYRARSMSIMSDPDVAAAQRQSVQDSMSDLQSDMTEFFAQLADLRDTRPQGSVNSYLDAMRGGGDRACVSGGADCAIVDPENGE